MKQKELSIWLKAIAALAFACCVFMCGFIVPQIGREAAAIHPELAYMYWPCLIFFWVTIVPVAAALILAWLIFIEIGRDNSFCMKNAKRLRAISGLAVLDTVFYLAAAVVFSAKNMTNPGVMLLFLAVIVVGVCIAVIGASLSHLTAKAAVLKDDSDLTI